MTKGQAVWHFVRAVLVGVAIGTYAYHILINKLVLNDTLIRLPYFEAGFVLSSFIGGAVLGLTPDRLRKGGVWVGILFAFSYSALWAFATAVSVSLYYNMHYDRSQNFLMEYVLDWTWRSMLIFFCCALAGYCGQLWVSKWQRRRSEKKPLVAN